MYSYTFPSDQSDFIEVAGRENDTSKVSEVNFYIDEGFTERVYSSCRDVVSPSTTGTVMDLMCGAWGSNLCTPRRDDGRYMHASRVDILIKFNDITLGAIHKGRPQERGEGGI